MQALRPTEVTKTLYDDYQMRSCQPSLETTSQSGLGQVLCAGQHWKLPLPCQYKVKYCQHKVKYCQHSHASRSSVQIPNHKEIFYSYSLFQPPQ